MEVFRNNTSDWHRRDDWNIELHVQLSGHGNKHIYDGPKATADRILNPKPGERIPNASTHAFSAHHMDLLVKDALQHNSSLIDNWLNKSKLGRRLEINFEPSSKELTGYGIKLGGTSFEPTKKITIWLIRTPNGYRIHNFYPSFE